MDSFRKSILPALASSTAVILTAMWLFTAYNPTLQAPLAMRAILQGAPLFAVAYFVFTRVRYRVTTTFEDHD